MARNPLLSTALGVALLAPAQALEPSSFQDDPWEEYRCTELPVETGECIPLGMRSAFSSEGAGGTPWIHLARARRLHPLPPDVDWNTEEDLQDGRTWIAVWSDEFAGEEDAFLEVLKALSGSKTMRTVVLVEAREPLRECERLRFHLGHTAQGRADWILRYPDGDSRRHPSQPAKDGLFTPGKIVIVDPIPDLPEDFSAESIGIQLGFMLDGLGEDYKVTEELEDYRALVEQLEDEDGDPPSEAELLEARERAYRSLSVGGDFGKRFAWRRSGDDLQAWIEEVEAPPLKDVSNWTRILRLSEAQDMRALLKEIDNKRKEVQKQIKAFKTGRRDAPPAHMVNSALSQYRRRVTDIAVAFSKDAMYQYDASLRGRCTGLEATQERFDEFFEWLEKHPLDKEDRKQGKRDVDLSDSYGKSLDFVFGMQDTRAFKDSLKTREEFLRIVKRVKFNYKKLQTEAKNLEAFIEEHPDAPEAHRARVWLELLEAHG